MRKTFQSLFEIGEPVRIRLQSFSISGHVRAVIFTSSKVRYSVRVQGDETTLHNVDSAFVEQVPEVERIVLAMPEDNYS